MSRMGQIVDKLEEGFIALLLAGMTLVTFTQVVLRYVFNSGFVWALELVTFLFAWMVLFGASYGVKKHAHLGVDAFVKLFGPGPRRIMGLVAVAAGILYGILLLIGGADRVYRLMLIGIPALDLPIPLWVPMLILPIGLALLILRLAQVGYRIITGEQEGLLLGDEAKEAIDAHLEEMDDPVTTRRDAGTTAPGDTASPSPSRTSS